MALSVLTDHAEIRGVLERLVAADPVRNTIMGTVGVTLGESAWAAVDGDLVAVRSSADYPLLVAGAWPQDALEELTRWLLDLPNLRGVSGAEQVVAPLAAALRGDRQATRTGQRLFRLDELTPPTGVAGELVVAGDRHRTTVRGWFRAFMIEADDGPAGQSDEAADRSLDGGGMWLWCDAGEPVAMASRRPVIGGSARIGPVYTPPERRGRGYGSAVTAAATRSILDERAIPVLFTDLANPTSNKIYQLLGYYPVEDRVVITFR